MSIRYSKEEKAQHVIAWQESGLSKTAYCQRENINIATFYYWLERNRYAQKMAVSDNSAPAFIPARLATASDNSSVVVKMNDSISISCQIAQLPDVLRALQGC